ncbi:hypothetical protein [Pseudomonas sp. BBP2017]|uniref:hypothetical protein n=1 Tax=Pseudomonas sp. BBP2017 TaxID=2109731 RepID=UPI000D12EBB2|nr:hypothetical protein [Pseudomonas sp. BBP2017]PSS59307.1 hypothetical protein C6382_01235 [Pseudomonas sp. BBP2017]
MAEQILKTKRVNFLVADAQINRRSVSAFGNASSLSALMEVFKKVSAGLWVGGKLVVTQSVIRLSANAVNRFVQHGTLDIEVPLALIRKVSVEHGYITKIVSLETDAGSVKFRCFGAKAIAREIERLSFSQTWVEAL